VRFRGVGNNACVQSQCVCAFYVYVQFLGKEQGREIEKKTEGDAYM